MPSVAGVSRRRLLLGPGQEFVERRPERLPPLRQVVLDLRGDLRMHDPHVPMTLKSVERFDDGLVQLHYLVD